MQPAPSEGVDLTVAVIGLVGVIVGAIIAAAAQWLMQVRAEKQERAYVTSNLVAALDQLAIDCCHVAQDDGTDCGHPDEDRRHSIRVANPEFALSSEQANLRHLDSATTYSVLIIPHRIKSIAHTVSNVFEYDDLPDFQHGFEERQYLFAQLGRDVAKLSDQIRREHKIPHRPHDIWNPVPDLQDMIALIDGRREKRSKSLGHSQF